MKKTNFMLGALALLLAGALVFTGCNQDPVVEPEEQPEETVVKTYSVTFDSNNGLDASVVTVKEGEKVTKPADPEKTGYTFDGWFNDTTAYDFDSAVTADLTLKAAWSVTTYKITYVLADGETNNEKNPATYTIESDDITLEAATGTSEKPNFVAWHKDSADGESVQTIKKGSTGDITLVAVFSAKATYKVIYYNGETKIGEATVEEGGKIEDKKIDVDGYDFEGWYSDAAFNTKITDFTTTSVTAETSVYGKYTKIIYYTVTFDKADGTETAKTTEKVREGGKVTKPENPAREGYKFLGWYVGENTFDFNTTITEDITVTAKWGLKVPLTSAVSGYGADISNVGNILKIVTPANPANDYTGYSQVQIALPATKDPVSKIMEKSKLISRFLVQIHGVKEF